MRSSFNSNVLTGFLVIAVVPLALFHTPLNAQDGFGNSGPPEIIHVPLPLDDLPVVIPIARNLPPDPGPSGNTTIEGIDADNDGVRDDVEREIVFAYPNNPKARAALYLMAKHYQSLLINRSSKDTLLNDFSYLSAWTHCLVTAIGDPTAGSRMLRPWVLNTYDRSKAYVTALGTVGSSNDRQDRSVSCP